LKTESLRAKTRRLLRQFDLRARKKLGQHFLINGQVLKLIVATAEIAPTDIIVEIGPGLGILTEALAQRAGQVIGVELDTKLANLLKEKLAPLGNVTIINQDVLKVDPGALLQQAKASTTTYKVVADLPYYITSPILRHFLQALVKPERMVVMVQKEVAQAIVAEPGGRTVLSVMVQFYGKPSIVSYVPARAFYPAPEVDSAILRVEVYPQPRVAISNESSFFELVQAGFTARRKQIANSLAQGLGLAKIEVLPILERARITPQRRAETLTLEEWARLWEAFAQMKRGK